MTIVALVGGQYGSEGKGLIVDHIAKDFSVHVRVGAANAGHTVWVDGEKHVCQQLPCAAYSNPQARCVIGPGALISVGILVDEIRSNGLWRKAHGHKALNLTVDHRAQIITSDHIRREQNSDLAERIGSTSTIAREGIGAAQAARVMREDECIPIGEYADKPCDGLPDLVKIADVPEHLWSSHLFGEQILLEGTQGAGLSLTTGQFPYVTSRNTTAAGLAADVGIGPLDISRVVMVLRSFPIRVAGNSGPFWPDSKEVEWEDIGVDPGNERTTVTKKIRRVATFSKQQARYAARLNSATELAITFMDYVEPNLRDESSRWDGTEYPSLEAIITGIEQTTGVPVTMLGTGPDTVMDRVSSLEAVPA